MQGNSLIKTFALLFGIVSIYQLSFTFISSGLERKAEKAAISKISDSEVEYIVKRSRVEVNYLDSIGDLPVLLYSSYNDAKTKELNQGLDLKGGINVILQISIKDLLKGLSENSANQKFNQALESADELQKQSGQTYLESFFEAFDLDTNQTKLSSPDIFGNRTLSEISFDTSEDEIKNIIARKIDESIISAFEVLRKRVDKFGVTQPNIQRLGTSGRILVELPGAKDIDRIQNLLQSTAQLEFWETYKNDELGSFLLSANEYLRSIEDDNILDDQEESNIEDLLSEVEETTDQTDTNQSNPLLSLIKSPSFQGGPVLANFSPNDQELISSYLNLPEVRKLLPSANRYIKFLWGKEDENGLIGLYAIKSNIQNTPPLSGGVVVDASQSFDATNNPAVSATCKNFLIVFHETPACLDASLVDGSFPEYFPL